jgi:putative CocE/NonD family hydrolase
MRLPYGRAIASTVTYAHPSWYAARGYIVAIQDVRGCGQSEGHFYPFQAEEMTDGVDTLLWCQSLSGSNGKVGMYGFSYQGVTQFQAVAGGGTAAGLTTICPSMATLDFYRGWNYWGGALALDFVLPWAVQLAQDQAQFRQLEPTATELGRARSRLSDWLDFTPLNQLPLLQNQPVGEFYFDWVRVAIADSDYYRRLNPSQYLRTFDLPALHIAGWADTFLEGTLSAYQECRQKTPQPQSLTIGPWQHIPWSRRVGAEDFGAQASPHIDALQIRWFDRWLKNEPNGIESEPLVRVFEMGANRWLSFSAWPPPAETRNLWLKSDGLANGPDSQGTLELKAETDFEFDTYVYDPRIANPTTPYGPYDQRAVHQRSDLLLYTSAPFETRATVCGTPKFHLYAATTAPDTDWVVKLMRLEPSGRAILMAAGVLRARFRHSWTEPSPVIPNQIEYYAIPLRPTCWTVVAGERLQLAIASAAFPWIDRNPNTGQWPTTAQFGDFQCATQTVFHSTDWPSRLELPLLADG